MPIVNTQTKFIRPRYRDLREWMNDKQNAYIGRKHEVFVSVSKNSHKKERFPYRSSVFANPYRVTMNMSQGQVIKLYEEHIRLKLAFYPELIYDLLSLKGKNIGSTNPNHAVVLLKLIDEIDSGDGGALPYSEVSLHPTKTQRSIKCIQ